MTLRQLIDGIGMCEKDLKNLTKSKDFKLIKNLDIITSENISDIDLIGYFDSNKFLKDISDVAENINKFIEAYPHFKTENFFLFISLSTPLKLDFKPLVG